MTKIIAYVVIDGIRTEFEVDVDNDDLTPATADYWDEDTNCRIVDAIHARWTYGWRFPHDNLGRDLALDDGG